MTYITETKYLKQDHDSHQQLSSVASVNQHPEQQPCSPPEPVPPKSKQLCESIPRSSKIMPKMHY